LSNAAYDTVKNLPGAETALGRAAIFSEQAASQTLWQRAGGWISGTWEAFNPFGKVLPTGPAPVATAVASPGGAASTYFSATWNGIFGGVGRKHRENRTSTPRGLSEWRGASAIAA
jgi:hypothetical protein